MAKCPKRCVPTKRSKRAKNCRFGVSKTTGKCLKNKRAKKARRSGGRMNATNAAHAMYG